jgi:hypothetical protein
MGHAVCRIDAIEKPLIGVLDFDTTVLCVVVFGIAEGHRTLFTKAHGLDL